MAKLIYYKCNVIGGFRLSDLNRQVSQDEIIGLEEHIANTSKAVIAAKKAGWLIEVKKPRTSSKKKEEDIDTEKENPPRNLNKSLGTSVPDAKRVNKSLETRQAEEIASKVSQPDFKTAAKPKNAEPQTGVSIPDIQEVQRNASLRQKDNLTNKDEIIKTVIVKQVDTIDKLAKDEEMNEGLSVPDFDEKGQDDEKPDISLEQVDVEETDSKKTKTKEAEPNEKKVEESPKDEEPKQTIRRKRTVV